MLHELSTPIRSEKLCQSFPARRSDVWGIISPPFHSIVPIAAAPDLFPINRYIRVMLQDNLLLIISLLFVVSMLAMLSDKLRISYPILLVIAGLIIGFIPGILDITLDPDMVFIIFLPPLLYAAAWNTSWHDFWQFRRPISLLGFGLVIFTATAVACTAHLMIPRSEEHTSEL